MAKKRDYKAEYARRNALAKKRGFSSYSQQRRAIERGKIPAIQPHRVRSKKTLDAQEKSFGILGRKTVKDFRIEAGVAWSERNARSNRLKFDPVRAKKDDAYLSAYLGATVMQTGKSGEDDSTLVPSPDLRILLVNVLGLMTDNEYDSRYGDRI